MPVYKQPQPAHFTRESPVEKHFHDYDETWVITAGRAHAYMVDRDGVRSEFELEQGDIWMVEAGIEHGCDPIGEEGVDIFPFPGTIPQGSHALGHYYMERERYMPTLIVQKTAINRYTEDAGNA